MQLWKGTAAEAFQGMDATAGDPGAHTWRTVQDDVGIDVDLFTRPRIHQGHDYHQLCCHEMERRV